MSNQLIEKYKKDIEAAKLSIQEKSRALVAFQQKTQEEVASLKKEVKQNELMLNILKECESNPELAEKLSSALKL